MKRTFTVFLLFALALLFMSLYNEETVLSQANVRMKGEEQCYSYDFSYEYITEIKVLAYNAEIRLFVNSAAKYITVKSKGTQITGEEKDKRLSISSDLKNRCELDIYLPQRQFEIVFEADKLVLENVNSMKGSLSIFAKNFSGNISGFSGIFYVKTDEGNVNVRGGNLKKLSQISILNRGNIYLNCELSETNEKYIFQTEEGHIYIEGNTLKNTMFDVYAISIEGEYEEYMKNGNTDDYKSKAEVSAVNGLVHFDKFS